MCVHWYFAGHFSELRYIFFSKSRGPILDELRVSCKNHCFPESLQSSYIWNTFPFTIIKWNKWDPNIRSWSLFLIYLKENFRIWHLTFGSNFLTRLRVGLIHIHEHKFRNNVRDSLHTICNKAMVLKLLNVSLSTAK